MQDVTDWQYSLPLVHHVLRASRLPVAPYLDAHRVQHDQGRHTTTTAQDLHERSPVQQHRDHDLLQEILPGDAEVRLDHPLRRRVRQVFAVAVGVRVSR